VRLSFNTCNERHKLCKERNSIRPQATAGALGTRRVAVGPEVQRAASKPGALRLGGFDLRTFATRSSAETYRRFPSRSRLPPPLPPLHRNQRRGPLPACYAHLQSTCAAWVASACGGGRFAAMDRQFQDDLLAVNSARLRALGVIGPDAVSAIVCFGEGEAALKREVRVWHRQFRNGRAQSLFYCPHCGGKAQILKVYDGRVQCRRCLIRAGVQFRAAYGSREERAAARERRIEALKAKLAGGSLRVHPRGGRGIERRRELELSLRRALIREREKMLEADR
jgi:hypothetical protein